jgi:hypothetical protein
LKGSASVTASYQKKGGLNVKNQFVVEYLKSEFGYRIRKSTWMPDVWHEISEVEFKNFMVVSGWLGIELKDLEDAAYSGKGVR